MERSFARTVVFLLPFLFILFWLELAQGCGGSLLGEEPTEASVGQEDLRIDPATGIPYAPVFQIPIAGFTTSDFGFGFGDENRSYCLERSGAECLAFGLHLGRDTLVAKTPAGTEIVAPADGIVRVTTDVFVGGYGADAKSNPSYNGCVILIEHEFPNGQAVTSLVGHVRCESGKPYDVVAKSGNPAAGTVVHRGQYVAHVGTFYHGATDAIDWSHLHWGMRLGRFTTSSGIGPYVRGYAKRSEFTVNPSMGALVHPDWIDPFVVIAASGDPAMSAALGIRFHPSGSILEDQSGNYWIVTGDTEIASLPHDVFTADRYDAHAAIRVSDEEIGCYAAGKPLASHGRVTLYQRPGSSTVVMALDDRRARFDFIRWESLLSWGFNTSDISTKATDSWRDALYVNKGMRLLRPGTLVKADEESEVAIVTWNQTRLPIASADVFEVLGFSWERVLSVPKDVLTTVAGPRESVMLDWERIHRCAVPKSCPGGGTCGGGGESDAGVSDAGLSGGSSDSVSVTLSYNGPAASGSIWIEAWWQPPKASVRPWGKVAECVDAIPGDGKLVCTFSLPSGTAPFEFQVYLPDGRFWGDMSFDATGGRGSTIGSVSLTTSKGALAVTMAPNNPSGQPYYNGRVSSVP